MSTESGGLQEQQPTKAANPDFINKLKEGFLQAIKPGPQIELENQRRAEERLQTKLDLLSRLYVEGEAYMNGIKASPDAWKAARYVRESEQMALAIKMRKLDNEGKKSSPEYQALHTEWNKLWDVIDKINKDNDNGAGYSGFKGSMDQETSFLSSSGSHSGHEYLDRKGFHVPDKKAADRTMETADQKKPTNQ